MFFQSLHICSLGQFLKIIFQSLHRSWGGLMPLLDNTHSLCDPHIESQNLMKLPYNWPYDLIIPLKTLTVQIHLTFHAMTARMTHYDLFKSITRTQIYPNLYKKYQYYLLGRDKCSKLWDEWLPAVGHEGHCQDYIC